MPSIEPSLLLYSGFIGLPSILVPFALLGQFVLYCKLLAREGVTT